jgi:hypothetical protein
MAETIVVDFADIAGDVSAYTAFVRSRAGALLNTGGDAISEIGGGVWNFTLTEARVVNTHYFVRIYSGSTETPANLVYDGILYPGQLLVNFDGDLKNLTTIRGTVSSGSVTSMTPSALTPACAKINQFKGRILVFDATTTTPELRGQITDITANTGVALPLFTFTSLTTAPAAGDTFTIT